jgi:hypothetical protein
MFCLDAYGECSCFGKGSVLLQVWKDSHCGGPGSSPGLVKWDLWWTKWRWDRFYPSTSISLASLHSIKFSIIIITRGRYNRPISGRRAEWTQLDSTTCEFKKKAWRREELILRIFIHCCFTVFRPTYNCQLYENTKIVVFVHLSLGLCGQSLAAKKFSKLHQVDSGKWLVKAE